MKTGKEVVLLRGLVISTRPRQWSKNLLLFAALLFSKNFFNPEMLGRVFLGFAGFCLITGATYLFNDVIDRKNDATHPEKRSRPVASGELSPNLALSGAVVMVLLGLTVAHFVDILFLRIAVLYLLLQIAYSLLLKKIVILDVLAITTGFGLRVLAGGLIIHVAISSWLLLCTFLLALFLALCKRRHEVMLLGNMAPEHREVLSDYSIPLLDQMISVTTASVVIAYTLYTLDGKTVGKFGTEHLLYTVPFVVYGIFRYLYLVYIRNEGGSPETLLLKDLPLSAGIILWASAAAMIIYL